MLFLIGVHSAFHAHENMGQRSESERGRYNFGRGMSVPP
jgi:hypothetical protein